MPRELKRAKRRAPRRVLLVSDTHGDVDPRIARLAASCDLVVHAGDIGNRGVLARLRPRGGRTLAVRGNNDIPEKWPAADRAALARLRDEITLKLPGGILVATHGDRLRPASKRHDGLRRAYPLARAVVYGHTHRMVCDRRADPWVLNPGAAGRTRTFGGPSCLLLLTSARGWRLRRFRFAVAERPQDA